MSIIEEAFPALVELARLGGSMSIPEAAEVDGLNVKPRTVRSWIYAGRGGVRSLNRGRHTHSRELRLVCRPV